MSTFINDDMDIVRPFQGRWMSVLYPWVAPTAIHVFPLRGNRIETIISCESEDEVR